MYDVASAPRLIAKNTASQILGRVAFLALSLLNFKLVASYLGPHLFGDFGNVFNYTALFTVLTDCGLFIVAVREIAKKPESRQQIMENVLALRLVLTAIATILTIGVATGIAYLFPASNYLSLLPAIWVGALAMLVYFMSNMLDVVFHIELKMHFVAAVELIGKIVAVAMVIVAVKLDAGFIWIIASVAGGNLAGLLARYWTARRFFTIRLRFDWHVWRWLLSMAVPLGIVFALNNLYFKVDGVMLYLMKGSYDNGLYTAAFRVLETTIFASAFFVQALTPYLSNYLTNKPQEARRLIAVGNEIMLSLGGILTLAIFFYAPEIITLLSGEAFLPAAWPLLMLSFVATLMYINSLFGQVLVLQDVRRVLLVVSAGTLLFNIVLNLLLIPRFSFIGAAAATLLSESILLVVNTAILRGRQLLDIRAGNLARIFLALGLAAILFAVAVNRDLPWLLPFFAIPLLYFLLLWKQGVLPLGIILRKEPLINETNTPNY